MLKRLFLAACCLGVLLATAAPAQPASACPLVCYYDHGKWVCGCS